MKFMKLVKFKMLMLLVVLELSFSLGNRQLVKYFLIIQYFKSTIRVKKIQILTTDKFNIYANYTNQLIGILKQ